MLKVNSDLMQPCVRMLALARLHHWPVHSRPQCGISAPFTPLYSNTKYLLYSQLFVFYFCLLSQLFKPVLQFGFELRTSLYKVLAHPVAFASNRPCHLTNHIPSLRLGLADLLG